MEETRSPVLRRLELGALLRKLRTDKGMTVDQVTKELLFSPSKLSRLETGQRGASARDIRDLCNLYEVDDAQRENLTRLAKDGRSHAWWQPYDLPYATYVGLEAEAAHISDFEPGVFPGLLQTSAYARSVHESGIPRLSSEVIERRIEERRRRQAVLTRGEPPPPQLRAIVDEAVIHRMVGGPGVMGGQLRHVIDACKLPNVSVQILPFHAGAHPALDSTFILLEFEQPLPAVVYVEGLAGPLYFARTQDVERYLQVFLHLSNISLSPQESLELMAGRAAAYLST